MTLHPHLHMDFLEAWNLILKVNCFKNSLYRSWLNTHIIEYKHFMCIKIAVMQILKTLLSYLTARTRINGFVFLLEE